MKIIEPKYKYVKIEKVFEKLISGNAELVEHFSKEVNLSEYNLENDLPYVDVGSISNYIVEKKLKNQTSDFELFFENVEEIYVNGDSDVQNLMVVGLFEGIQNIGGGGIEYYRSFNKWLKFESQKAWNELIDFWEGKEWKKNRREQKNTE